MKNRLLFIFMFCVLLLFGCNNPKPSADLSSHQIKIYKSAVNVIDEYLNDSLDHLEADDKLMDIYYKIESSDDNDYLFLGCSTYILSNKEEDRKKIIEYRNKIAELCGVEEYTED